MIFLGPPQYLIFTLISLSFKILVIYFIKLLKNSTRKGFSYKVDFLIDNDPKIWDTIKSEFSVDEDKYFGTRNSGIT